MGGGFTQVYSKTQALRSWSITQSHYSTLFSTRESNNGF